MMEEETGATASVSVDTEANPTAHPGSPQSASSYGAQRVRFPGLLVVAALGAAFAHALWVSWLKWGDPVIDGGREMMMPARMLAGEVLYVDHRNLYGPLAPYLNMLLFKVFGVHLAVLQAAGLASAAAMALGVYLLSRRFLGRLPSTAITVVFLYAFAFGHLSPNPSFNFVVPYAYAATYGIVAATFSLLFLIRHAQQGKQVDFVLSVGTLALAALCKLEVFVPALAAHVVWIAAAVLMRRMNARSVAVYAVGFVVVALTYALLLARAGAELWTDNLSAVANTGSRTHVFETMGLLDIRDSLLMVGLSSIAAAVAVAVGVGADHLLRAASPAAARTVVVGLAGAACFVLYALVGAALAMRLLPVLAVAVVAALMWRFLRDDAGRREVISKLLLWVFSAACLVRLGLVAGPAAYGFFLGPVPFVAASALLFGYLLRRTQEAWGQRAALAAGLGVLGGIAFSALAVSAVMYAEHVMQVRTARGEMWLRGEPWQPDLVAYLQRLPKGTRIAAIPQGAGLLFLAGANMTGGLYSYAPMEMSGRYTDERVVAQFAAEPPDVVVQLTQDAGSFRWTGFGVEYGHRTAAWLRANYVPVAGSREVTVLRYIGPPRPTR